MKRLKLNLDEVFGVLLPSQEEVEIPRTPDWGKPTSPNWSEKTKIFSLGCHNAENSILSNMIASKTKSEPYGLNDFLDFAKSSQRMLIELINSILDKLLARLGGESK